MVLGKGFSLFAEKAVTCPFQHHGTNTSKGFNGYAMSSSHFTMQMRCGLYSGHVPPKCFLIHEDMPWHNYHMGLQAPVGVFARYAPV